LAEAHVLAGVIKFRFDWDWTGAERDLKRGLELNPNSSRAHLGYSTYLLAMGRIDDAIRIAQRNVEIDPLTVQRYVDLGWKLSYARRHDEAITQLKKGLEITPDYADAYGGLGRAYAAKLMPAAALAMCEKAVAGHAGSFVISDCGHVYVLAGKRREALELLTNLMAQRSIPQYQVARLYDALGNREQAVHWLIEAYEARAPEMCFLRIDTVSEALRSDPRFQAVLRRMNFPS
jgi:serine/threonine-protein kinase